MVDAAGIIGSGSPGDNGLSPVEHAEQLKTSAPKFAALLTRSAPVELARQYAEADTEALVAERTFKRWVSRANWAVLGTATASALLMAVALLADSMGGLAQATLIVLALTGVATGGIASMSLFRVKEGRSSSRRNKARRDSADRLGDLALRLTAGARVSGSGQYGERRGGAGLHQLSTPGDGMACATALRPAGSRAGG